MSAGCQQPLSCPFLPRQSPLRLAGLGRTSSTVLSSETPNSCSVCPHGPTPCSVLAVEMG